MELGKNVKIDYNKLTFVRSDYPLHYSNILCCQYEVPFCDETKNRQ